MMEYFILMILVLTPGVWSRFWKVTLKNQCALKGTSVVIKCSYDYPDGHTVTEVDWFKLQTQGWSSKKVLLSELPMRSRPDFEYVGDKHVNCDLKINNVKPTDEGKYYFSFVTDLNQWTSQSAARLTVQEPQLTAVVSPTTPLEGSNVQLICWSGCPSLPVIWFRDGQSVTEPRFLARREDAGSYYCEVQTARSASVVLDVRYAPEAVTLSMSPPADIVRGSSVTFTCSCEANPPVKQGYRLYKDGWLSVSSGAEHTISDIQPSHSGLYHCEARNNIMSKGNYWVKSAEMRLDVQYAPKDVTLSMSPPADIVRGTSVTFTCSCEANPPAGYSLYNDRGPVSSGAKHTISDIQPSDSGLYYCQAWNTIRWKGISWLNSDKIRLDVQYAPKDVTLSMSPSADIVRGSSVTFTCSCEANPPVTPEGYSLYKDRGFVSSGVNHTISDIQPSDSGLYHCQARNNINWMGTYWVNSTGIRLDVQYEPMNVSVSVEPQQVDEGGSVNLTCSSEAYPVADSYTWYRRGTQSANPNSMVQVDSGQMMSLHLVEASHSGMYFCQARNSMGKKNSTEVLLTVERMDQGSQSIIGGLAGLLVIVALVTVCLLSWKKLRACTEKYASSRVNGLSSSVKEDPLDNVYANITVPSSPPLVSADQNPTFDDGDVIYTTVTVKHKSTNVTPHVNPKAPAEEENSVIYATVAKARGS